MSEPREWVLNQPDDPGPVGAGMIWVNPSTEPPTVQVRKSDNSGWDSIGGGGGGGGNMIMQPGFETFIRGDNLVNWTADGSPSVDVFPLLADPPDFMDTEGNFILPGMYQAILNVVVTAASTTPTAYIEAVSPFNLEVPIPLIYPVGTYFVDFITLQESDLPTGGNWALRNIPTDETAAGTARAIVAQFATLAS